MLQQLLPKLFHSNSIPKPQVMVDSQKFFGQAFSLWKEQGAEALKEEFNDLWLKAGLVNSGTCSKQPFVIMVLRCKIESPWGF